MHVPNGWWQGVLAVMLTAALTSPARADEKNPHRLREVVAVKGQGTGLRFEKLPDGRTQAVVTALRVDKLPDGKWQIVLADGAIKVNVAADEPSEAVRKALANLVQIYAGPGKAGAEKAGAEKAGAEKAGAEKAGAEKAGAEKAGAEKPQGVMTFLKTEPKAPPEGGPAKQKAEAPKEGVMVLRLHHEDGAAHAPLPRDKMALLVKRQQELVEQAGQIVKKLHNLKDGQDAEARELAAQFHRVQAQLRELTQAAAPAPMALKVQAQTAPKTDDQKRIIVHVVPKPGSEGAPAVARLALPAPPAEIKELQEQMKLLKQQMTDVQAALKALAQRDKPGAPKP